MAKVLYLSYDGLTDNLGQSQIIPYLNGLAKCGHRIQVISVDKPEAYSLRATAVKEQMSPTIDWHSIPYTKSPPFISTILDLRKMSQLAMALVEKSGINIVHVRSYPPMEVALKLKARFKLKLVFDMRGFYPEERIDGNIWSMSNPVHRLAFNQLKKKEKGYMMDSDHIISLTDNARSIIEAKFELSPAKVTVIPCCADFEHFDLKSARQDNSLDIIYLGSLGTWYLIPEMLKLFRSIHLRHPQAHLHVVTADKSDDVLALADEINLPAHSLSARSAERHEVPALIKNADIALFLIKESYSKAASSPTKLAEFLACGIPVICNSGVGDLARIASRHKGVSAFPVAEIERRVSSELIQEMLALAPVEIRAAAEVEFSHKVAIARYDSIYSSLSQSLESIKSHDAQ